MWTGLLQAFKALLPECTRCLILASSGRLVPPAGILPSSSTCTTNHSMANERDFCTHSGTTSLLKKAPINPNREKNSGHKQLPEPPHWQVGLLATPVPECRSASAGMISEATPSEER